MVITENNINIIAIAVAETLKQLANNETLKNNTIAKEERELLSIKEVLELYPNLSVNGLRDAINNKGLRYIQMGKGKKLIDRKDLEDFLEKQKQTEKPVDTLLGEYHQININGILNKVV